MVMLILKRRSLPKVCISLVNDQCVGVKRYPACLHFVEGGIPWFVESPAYLKAEGRPPFVVGKLIP